MDWAWESHDGREFAEQVLTDGAARMVTSFVKRPANGAGFG